MKLFALLRPLLTSLSLHRARQRKLLRILSIGPTAAADGEALEHIDDLLAVEAEVALDAVFSVESCREDLCYPRGARLIMPEGFWETRDAATLRLDEAYDAIVISWDDPNIKRLGSALYSMLRTGGLLLIRWGEQVADPQDWLQAWFTDIRRPAAGVLSAVRRDPEPFRLDAGRLSVGTARLADYVSSGPNCTSGTLQQFARRCGALVQLCARELAKVTASVERQPVDVRQVQLQLTLALGDVIRALEGAVVATVARCEVPLPPRFESALGLAFQAASRFWTEHRKANFYLWVGKDQHASRPADEQDAAVSVPHAKKVCRDLAILVDFSRAPVVAVAGLDPGEGTAGAGSAGTAGKGEAPSHMGDIWSPASSAGEYPDSSLIYRSVFRAQQVDEGLLKAMLSQLLVTGDSVADFGASLGEYSIFLNRTGLVTAFAFDGSPAISAVTKGAVHTLLLDQPFALWQTFDWVLCLEVLEHIPQHSSQVALENLRRHARKGAVISWAKEYTNFLDPLHVNGRDDPEVLEAMGSVGFQRDEVATARLRAASTLWWVADSVAVFRAV